jgi:hypothetical protein
LLAALGLFFYAIVISCTFRDFSNNYHCRPLLGVFFSSRS